jgi:hypothetical protein
MLNSWFIYHVYWLCVYRPVDDIFHLYWSSPLPMKGSLCRTISHALHFCENSHVPTPAMTLGLCVSYLKNPWFSYLYDRAGIVLVRQAIRWLCHHPNCKAHLSRIFLCRKNKTVYEQYSGRFCSLGNHISSWFCKKKKICEFTRYPLDFF